MALAVLGTMAITATVPSVSQAEPYLELINACRSDPSSIDNIASRLLELGWEDVSSDESYTAFMRETLNQMARAKLSGASYPDRWTDATVGRSYPSTMATSLADVQSDIEANVAVERFSDPSVAKIVLTDSDPDAIAVLYQPKNAPSIQCWLVGMAVENPTLVNEIRSNSRRAERGYTVNQWPVAGLSASVTVLSDHARQADPRFPVKFDFSLAFHVPKG